MIDHAGWAVADIKTSRDFYVKALAPLGLSLVREGDNWAAFGHAPHTEFWIGTWGPPPGRVHIAFSAKSRGAVRGFHTAALAAGGKDNGPPGIREHYHANYFAAFVIDPEGHNIEAVCHTPEP